MDATLKVKRRKSNLSTAIRVNYRPKPAGLSRRVVPTAGRKQVCDFFEANGSCDSNTHVFQTCMTLLKDENNPLAVCTLFAGALAAYFRSMKQTIKDTLTKIGVDLNIIHLPEQAEEHGIDLAANDMYYACDVHVVMGACVCILFENFSDRSYAKFIGDRLCDLGGMFGMSKDELANLTPPVTANQAEYIRGKLGSNNKLKKEILLYLMELADSGEYVEAFSRHLCTILSWNEMTDFMLVYDKLWQTHSPVLRQVRVRHEVVKFAEAVSAVARSPYPQFFRYFCSWDQEQLVERSRFPILAGVTHRLKDSELELVAKLVELHNAFMRTGMMGPTRS